VISVPKIYLRPILLAAFALWVFGLGCRPSIDDLTVWKTEIQSPDGLWIASARTIQNGGLGSANIATVIYLKSTKNSEPPTEVLAFDCQGPVPRPYVLDNVANAGGTINLTMKWVSPTHLEVTYEGRAGSLEFQVLKIAGIDISVRDLSSEPANDEDSK
jgi:hypothetical protein